MYGLNTKHDYFNWLCDLVHIDQIERSYWILAKDLFGKEFIAIIEHDENRASDGIELREEYMREIDPDGYLDLDEDCSVLEMMIALAKRMDFETSDPNDPNDVYDTTSYWFWEMIENLGLIEFDDRSYVDLDGQTYVEWILDGLIDRQYESNGDGGLFPLKEAHEDQRHVEIWYQMSAYLMEHHRV